MKIIPVKLPHKSASIPCYVDGEDYAVYSGLKWCLTAGYASRSFNGKTTYLHRLIMKPERGQVIDHINGNKLENRKKNLRVCAHRENIRNQRLSIANTSGYKGVTWSKRDKRFIAQITADKNHYCLGYFKSAIEAAQAYDEAAEKLHGQYAKLNGV